MGLFGKKKATEVERAELIGQIYQRDDGPGARDRGGLDHEARSPQVECSLSHRWERASVGDMVRWRLSRDLLVASTCLALLTGACTSGSSSTPSPTPPPSVSGLEAKKVAFSTVTLAWAALDSTDPDTSIVVLRDGIELKTLPSRATAYVDNSAHPGTLYKYQVKVIQGGLESIPDGVTVRTSVPPVTEARLDGIYAMTFITVESTISGGGGTDQGKWKVTSLCASGPCDVRLESLSGGYTVRLAWISSGGRYKGFVLRRGQYTCQSRNIDAGEQIVATVDSAKVVAGEWLAVKLTGQLTYDQSESDNCFPSAHEVYAFRGSFVK